MRRQGVKLWHTVTTSARQRTRFVGERDVAVRAVQEAERCRSVHDCAQLHSPVRLAAREALVGGESADRLAMRSVKHVHLQVRQRCGSVSASGTPAHCSLLQSHRVVHSVLCEAPSGREWDRYVEVWRRSRRREAAQRVRKYTAMARQRTMRSSRSLDRQPLLQWEAAGHSLETVAAG